MFFHERLKKAGYSQEYIDETLNIANLIHANMVIPAQASKLEPYTDRKQLCLVVNEKVSIQFQFTTIHNVSSSDVKAMLFDMLTWKEEEPEDDK
jgi:hypothetical protein